MVYLQNYRYRINRYRNMHIVRIRCWVKLHRRYISEHEGWTQRHMLGIVIFDEVIWLAVFAAICAILVMVL